MINFSNFVMIKISTFHLIFKLTKQKKISKSMFAKCLIILVCIFLTGGVILFYKAFCVLKFDILDCLIKKVLLQVKTSENSYFLKQQ